MTARVIVRGPGGFGWSADQIVGLGVPEGPDSGALHGSRRGIQKNAHAGLVGCVELEDLQGAGGRPLMGQGRIGVGVAAHGDAELFEEPGFIPACELARRGEAVERLCAHKQREHDKEDEDQ